jgi:hypothetical protein
MGGKHRAIMPGKHRAITPGKHRAITPGKHDATMPGKYSAINDIQQGQLVAGLNIVRLAQFLREGQQPALGNLNSHCI